ncbi:MAG: hypothetical protein FWD71_20435 [Oscillospiraceae bacterium]|nr:hypothetical protein [Oscillospiraceae bacterium]
MHIFSTLFTAQSVDKELRTPEGLQEAVNWCKTSALQKVYIESFRGNLFVEQDLLESVRDRFLEEGFSVCGCVTTTKMLKLSNGWSEIACYSHKPNLELMESIFRRTAAVFDTIMIDDFLFTDCTCEDCEKARGGRSFDEYHSDVMVEMCLERILRPAREVNPSCKIIIKYPLWYEDFQKRGYDVIRQTRNFDMIWGGTETRDPDNENWGCYPQTQAFYMMVWDMKLDPEKCGGGWYDPYGTNPATYLEQARQTILSGVKESMLFCYGSLYKGDEGVNNTAAIRRETAGLHKLAYLVAGKKINGVSVPKVPGCDTEKEKYLSSFYGMLGIPVAPDIHLDPDAKSAILGYQAVGFPDAPMYAKDALKSGKAICFSEGFLEYMALDVPKNALVIRPGGDNWNLTEMPQPELDALRNALLKHFDISFTAPSKVALNLYDDDLEIIQNFNDFAVEVTIDLKGRNPKSRNISLVLSEGNEIRMSRSETKYTINIPPRTLTALY